MFRKSHQKTICSTDPHIHCISADAFSNCCMCIKARICKLRKLCHHGTFLGPHWWSDSVCNCTSAKNRLHAEAQRTWHQHVHGRAKTSGDHVIKKGGSSFQLERKLQDGLDTADSLTCLLSGFTEHDWKIYMDTGVIQLNDSLEAQKTDSEGVKWNIWRDEVISWNYAILTWGVRFLYILFSLAFLCPFFVTTVSS